MLLALSRLRLFLVASAWRGDTKSVILPWTFLLVAAAAAGLEEEEPRAARVGAEDGGRSSLEASLLGVFDVATL